jgi:hypothetical protein
MSECRQPITSRKFKNKTQGTGCHGAVHPTNQAGESRPYSLVLVRGETLLADRLLTPLAPSLPRFIPTVLHNTTFHNHHG